MHAIHTLMGMIGKEERGRALYDALLKSNYGAPLLPEEESEGSGSVSYEKFLENIDLLFLTIHPDAFPKLAKKIKPLSSKKIIISLMPGVSIESIRREIGAEVIVRCIPTLSIREESGVVIWCTQDAIDEETEHSLQKIFQCMGEEFHLRDEREMEQIAPVVYGAEPLFLSLCEWFEENIKEIFSDEKTRHSISKGLLMSASQLLFQSNRSYEEWRKAITSPGGVTETMIQSFSSEKYAENILHEAIKEVTKKVQSYESDI